MLRRRPAVLAALALAAVLAVAAAGPTDAARTPRSRATLNLDGNAVHLDVALTGCRPKAVSGAIEVDVSLPKGVDGAVLGEDGGFRHKGYAIAFTERATPDGPISLTVLVPTKKTSCALEIGFAYVDPFAGPAMAGPARSNEALTLDIVR